MLDPIDHIKVLAERQQVKMLGLTVVPARPPSADPH